MSTDLSCRQVEQIVQSFLDGELPNDQAADVATHLERCEECGIDARTIDRVRLAIANLRIDLPAATMGRLRAGLDDVSG